MNLAHFSSEVLTLLDLLTVSFLGFICIVGHLCDSKT